MQQYFVKEIDGKFILKDEDFYHLTTVLRAKNKNIICVKDDEAYLCNFTFDGNKYNIEIIEKQDRDNELSIDIELYQALIRNENFDLVLQKATELGVASIAPTIFNRNVVKIDKSKEESKVKRYENIVKNASEQSHRNIVPEILPITNIKDIDLDDAIGIVCYEKCEVSKNLSALKDAIKQAKRIKVVIGPEGGITENEHQSLIEKGFNSVSLGKRILRSETAAFYILSVLQYIIEIED